MRIIKFVVQLIIFGIAVAAVLLAIAWWFGPRTKVDTTIAFDASSIGADLDAYLLAEETKIAGIKPNQQKQIVWANPTDHRRTPVALVYIHGFSASPGEIRPVPEMIAKALNANLFFTRLAGHGLSVAPMEAGTVNAWVNDFAEAIALGERLGDQVVVIATSTGASITTWGLGQPAFRDRIAAAIFLSPNYQVKAAGSFLLTQPFAREIAHALLGETRSFEPYTRLHAEYWTTRYTVDALLPMAETVRLAQSTLVEGIKVPVLVLISPEDTVVEPEATRKLISRWGGPHQLIDLPGVEDPARHVLAGAALSPGTTEQAARIMTDWLRQTL